MYKILEKKVWLSEEPAIKEFVLDAPEIAKAHDGLIIARRGELQYDVGVFSQNIKSICR